MINDPRWFLLDREKSAFMQIRQKLGLNRAIFGELLGVNEDTIGTWERGKNAPRLTIRQIKVFTKILADVGLTWDDLPDDASLPFPIPQDITNTAEKQD